VRAGLFFGSYNPIHIGHLAIANYMVEYTDMDQVWFVISPQNPFKKRRSLLADHHRLEMVRLAIAGDDRFRESDIEFRMPKPSFTIDTLTYLGEKYPKNLFVLIMGSDGLTGFEKWKNAPEIIRNYTRYIYPRPGYAADMSEHANTVFVNAPQIELSASMIRDGIKKGRDMRHFLPPGVWEYIDRMNLYR
jgi:nicotinate-nucleotide adenylyltransferase